MRRAASGGEGDRFPHSLALRGPELLEEPQGGAGVGANFVGPGLLSIEFLDHDHRQHHLMLIEAEGRGRVGKKYARVEDEGPSHSGMLLATGLTASPSPERNYKDRIPSRGLLEVRTKSDAYSGDGHIRSFWS